MFHVSCIQLIIVRAAPVYGTYIALLSFNVYVCKYKKSIYLSLSLSQDPSKNKKFGGYLFTIIVITHVLNPEGAHISCCQITG